MFTFSRQLLARRPDKRAQGDGVLWRDERIVDMTTTRTIKARAAVVVLGAIGVSEDCYLPLTLVLLLLFGKLFTRYYIEAQLNKSANSLK